MTSDSDTNNNMVADMAPQEAAVPDHVDRAELDFQRIKVKIHSRMVESLDLSILDNISQTELAKYVRDLAQHVCGSNREVLQSLDLDRMQQELLDETFGLGPLEQLIHDRTISDILINGPYTVYIERHGRLELTDLIFANDEHLIRIIRRVVGQIGRRIDEMSPMVDARLSDGSRVNAVIPPLVLNGPTMSIRRFGTEIYELSDLVKNGSVPEEVSRFVQAVIQARIGTIFSGGTGSGKTTMLNAFSAVVPETERLITIEDSAELRLRHRHWIRMETRPATPELKAAEITQRDLVRNSLRMRPDRIIVGEVRGVEVWDMLQAMNTGHEGSMTTVHANSTQDALHRLEMMCALTGFDLPVRVVRQHIVSGINIIVHLARLHGGRRRLVQVSEVTKVDGGEFVIHDIFRFIQKGVDADGNAFGQFEATGYTPQCVEEIEAAGLELPSGLFQQRIIE